LKFVGTTPIDNDSETGSGNEREKSTNGNFRIILMIPPSGAYLFKEEEEKC
jgi:hypothetical protein